MISKAFQMQLKAGCLANYELAHNPIPTALAEAMTDYGVIKFSIFHVPGSLDLFAYVEIEDEKRFADLAGLEVCQAWWREMTRYLACESPGDAKAIEVPLRGIFTFVAPEAD